MIERRRRGWAILSRSSNRLDGDRQWLEGSARFTRPAPYGGYVTMVFATRREAREFVAREYGYMRNRPDLRAKPHGWKMPKVVGVEVTVRVLTP